MPVYNVYYCDSQGAAHMTQLIAESELAARDMVNAQSNDSGQDIDITEIEEFSE